ncbi:Sec-independent protein translocase protein TatCy [Calycomorphotria hydatis]|uniref:Sec-independent protein translocase protein TatC n=2 Tax=Calycomorphotria hydatis TaxID=2528027 RepID=A0A517TDH1_9PLAN|nr:Sec-independent protein translocase protein TatCy [Calycomorphotria hydatis]
MSFGEHLEELRVRLWYSIIGLIIGVLASLFIGEYIVKLVSYPINNALANYGVEEENITNELEGFSFTTWMSRQLGFSDPPPKPDAPKQPPAYPAGTVKLKISRSELSRVLGTPIEADEPEEATNGESPEEPVVADAEFVELRVQSEAFRELADRTRIRPVTLNVQEAFLAYLKVAFVSGLLLASPWVFYQLWLFVASGLYPHERKYIHMYLPLSLTLFIGGAVFCFFAVFPFVLSFLLGFNEMLGITPQIRLSEWISFALMLPMMFGLSFQLPLVMLLLERLQIFDIATYRERRRMAILVIAVVSMMMTPADPMSMLLMMLPLVALYELGIWMCHFQPGTTNPYGSEAV